jgi:hypothetical protein
VKENATASVGKCANCHTPLRGPFCSVCGQRNEPHVHSFWEFLREAAEGLTHADSRVWRTLWSLLFRPGFLTVEYRLGRRARYLPPFRLYLVLSVLFFLVAAAMPHKIVVFDFNLDGAMIMSPLALEADANAPPGETAEERENRVCGQLYMGPWQSWIEPRMKAGCHKIWKDGGEGLGTAMLHNAPRALFVLLPLLALVMRLMYLKPYYVEHLLFFIHAHSFIFLLLLLYLALSGWVENTWIEVPLSVLVALYIPWYLFRALRRVYGQGWFVTFLKFSVLSLAYLTCVALMVVFTTVYTVLTL